MSAFLLTRAAVPFDHALSCGVFDVKIVKGA
jgi:hypothetical protein